MGMKKRAYVIDSTLATSLDDMKQRDMFLQPLYLMLGDNTYQDLVDVSGADFYEQVAQGNAGTTSQPALGDFLETYEEIKRQGYDEAFVFTISSELSGTYQSATMAKEIIEGLDVYVLDTRLASAVGALIVEDIRAYGASDISAEAVMAYAQKAFAAVDIGIYLGDLNPLTKGGRLSAGAALIGTLLNIKVLITLNDGKIEVISKERSTKKAFKKLVERTTNRKIKRIFVLQTNQFDLCDELLQFVKAEYPDMEIGRWYLSPVLGNHIGQEGTAIVVQYEFE